MRDVEREDGRGSLTSERQKGPDFWKVRGGEVFSAGARCGPGAPDGRLGARRPARPGDRLPRDVGRSICLLPIPRTCSGEGDFQGFDCVRAGENFGTSARCLRVIEIEEWRNSWSLNVRNDLMWLRNVYLLR